MKRNKNKHANKEETKKAFLKYDFIYLPDYVTISAAGLQLRSTQSQGPSTKQKQDAEATSVLFSLFFYIHTFAKKQTCTIIKKFKKY